MIKRERHRLNQNKIQQTLSTQFESTLSLTAFTLLAEGKMKSQAKVIFCPQDNQLCSTQHKSWEASLAKRRTEASNILIVNHNFEFITTSICRLVNYNKQISQQVLNRLNKIIVLSKCHQSINVVGGLGKQASTIQSLLYYSTNSTRDTSLYTTSSKIENWMYLN